MNPLSPFGQTSTDAILIRSPSDMAELLRSFCSEQAFTYALAAHEKACSGYDDNRTAFWADVGRLLSSERAGVQQAA